IKKKLNTQFSSQLLGLCLLDFSNAMTTDLKREWNLSSELITDLLVSVIVVGLDGLHQFSKSCFVFTEDGRKKQMLTTKVLSTMPKSLINCKSFCSGLKSSFVTTWLFS
uniref:Uncharacterized protein n=1 Tax=Cyprinus carpio TaxID=7962 RepID=A0A8C2CCU7_CYPCA